MHKILREKNQEKKPYENKNLNESFTLYPKKLYVWNFNVVAVKYKFKKKNL